MAKLYFYYAAMNAGKSTALLQSSYNYRERGMHTLLFTPTLDLRHALGKIHSRIGIEAEAVPFSQDFDFYRHVEQILEVEKKPIKCVFIDEAQFLSKEQVMQLTEITDELNLPVLAYGLRTDFQGGLFEGSQYLLAWAEELVEIKTICHCGKKATMNLRIDPEGNPVRSGDQIQIGGNASYLACCRKHFKIRLALP